MNNPNLDLKYQIYLKSSLKLQRSYIKSTLKHHYNREKCHVTMVAKFLDDNNREFLQRLRRKAKKPIGLDLGDVKESMTLFEKRRGRRP